MNKSYRATFLLDLLPIVLHFPIKTQLPHGPVRDQDKRLKRSPQCIFVRETEYSINNNLGLMSFKWTYMWEIEFKGLGGKGF